MAYVEYLKTSAKEEWYTSLELWGLGIGKKPKMPEILRHG